MGKAIVNSPLFISLKYQLLVAIPVLLAFSLVNAVFAYSFAIGVAIYVAPNMYFTVYAFRFRGAHLSRWISQSFSRGEFGKLALAGLGFAIAFRFVTPLHIPILFVGFVSMIILQWLIAWRVANQMAASVEIDKRNNL